MDLRYATEDVLEPEFYLELNFELAFSSIHPTVIAAHPQEVNQFALGLSDGSVHVIEPHASEAKWGVAPPPENGSTSNAPVTPSVGASSSDQPQR
ncbi:hypothetical protein SASPL_128770 [Salvia splendens]|uniref:Uncharacterized protein n=1 Tax=Salvia splendens TaxID=180675 RepID=A0A8X8XDA0_SALSN|nr:hypothetical protein SASPL_128770 [Salvia splendens]